MASDSTLVYAVDPESTPFASVNQRFSRSRNDSKLPLGLTFVARTVGGEARTPSVAKDKLPKTFVKSDGAGIVITK